MPHHPAKRRRVGSDLPSNVGQVEWYVREHVTDAEARDHMRQRELTYPSAISPTSSAGFFAVSQHP